MSVKYQGHSLTLAKGQAGFKIKNLFCSGNVGSFETEFKIKAYGRIGMQIHTNELDHMAKMISMSVDGKNL